jgi:hypothetical protein
MHRKKLATRSPRSRPDYHVDVFDPPCLGSPSLASSLPAEESSSRSASFLPRPSPGWHQIFLRVDVGSSRSSRSTVLQNEAHGSAAKLHVVLLQHPALTIPNHPRKINNPPTQEPLQTGSELELTANRNLSCPCWYQGILQVAKQRHAAAASLLKLCQQPQWHRGRFPCFDTNQAGPRSRGHRAAMC